MHSNRKQRKHKKADPVALIVLKAVLRKIYFSFVKLSKKIRKLKISIQYRIEKFKERANARKENEGAFFSKRKENIIRSWGKFLVHIRTISDKTGGGCRRAAAAVKELAAAIAAKIHAGEPVRAYLNKTGEGCRRAAVSVKELAAAIAAKIHAGEWIKRAGVCALASVKKVWGILFGHKHILASAGLVAAAVTVISYTAVNYDVGLNVYLGDEIVARVLNQQSFEDYIQAFNEQVSQEIGEPFQSDLKYYYEFAFVKKGEEGIDPSLGQKVLQNEDGVKYMAILSVDGQFIGANTKEAINSILNQIKMENSTGDTSERQEFAKDVIVEERLCSTSLFRSSEEINQILRQPEQKETTYTVEQGDTLSEIAPRYNMTTSQLLSLNSGVTPEKIRPGDEIVVSKEIPMLPVKDITTTEYTEEISYNTIKQNDSTLYINRTSTVQAGVKGVKKVVANITTISGEEVAREIVSEEVISQPVDCIIKVGTKPVPAGVPTGVFAWPVKGIITSPYGYRGREFHTGIDIAGSYGAAIKAADGGKVRFAGWNGNYGKCVIITHENGLETLYAHCSKLYVTAGQSVQKGFTIAAMGSTGRSTGTHLHFEVRQNGKTRNPLYALP